MANEQAASAIHNLSNRFLTFYMADEQYGIDISSVKEIIALMKTTPVPKTPKYFKGVMNLRGIIIPVVDLRAKFGMEETKADMQTAIIIVTIAGTNIGFVVDRVEEVLSINEEQFSEPPQFGTNIATDFLKSMARVGEEVVMLLELERLFSEEELTTFENVQQTKKAGEQA